MIVLDIESSGIDTGRCGIWQIGAIELENPKNYFLQEARIDYEDIVEKGAMKVTGKTEAEMRNSNKQSQKELIIKFLEWAKDCKNKLIIGQNIGWDLTFIQNKCFKYDLYELFRKTTGFKGLDTYAIAQIKHLEKKGNFSIKEDGRGEMGLNKILEFCGMPDNRINLNGEEIVKKGDPHNALEDAKLTGECFYRLIHGKNLFPEYSQYEIPEVLKNES
jgi:DNA polymerase III epsilon subunit-like protein